MKIYEEYESAKEKRQAQRGAKRGVATGKARGYVLVFNEDGIQWHYPNIAVYEAIGELMAGSAPGEKPHAIVSVTPACDYLQENCRFVGFDTIPQEWKQAFANHLDHSFKYDSDEDEKKHRKRYAYILKHRTR